MRPITVGCGFYYYQKVVRAQPRYGAALLGLGRVQVKSGHGEEAIRSMQDALATKQFDAEPEALGMIHSVMGVAYRATFKNGDAETTHDFTIPKPKTVPGTVSMIFPSADKLPENTLRFYVHFSKPMAEGREKREIEANERRKASIRAKVEHPFRVIKRQFREDFLVGRRAAGRCFLLDRQAELFKHDFSQLLGRSQIERLAGQFVSLRLKGHDLLAHVVTEPGKQIAVDQDAVTFDLPDHLTGRHFDLVVNA